MYSVATLSFPSFLAVVLLPWLIMLTGEGAVHAELGIVLVDEVTL